MFRRRFDPRRGSWQGEEEQPEDFPFDMPPHMRLRWARKMMREGEFRHGHHGHPMHFGHRGPGAWFAPHDGEHFDRMFGRGPRGGATLWSSGFLPTSYTGVALRSVGEPSRTAEQLERVIEIKCPHHISLSRQQINYRQFNRAFAFGLVRDLSAVR